MEVEHRSDWTMLNDVQSQQHGDHSQHMQHGKSSGECIMAMSWNTNTRDVCIITPAWHIRSSPDFVLTMLVIFGISVGYEYLKWVIRCIDVAIARLEDAQSSQGNRTLGDGEADMNSAAAASRRPRSNNTRRLIPLTYDDLLASESSSQRSFDGDPNALRKTNRASPSSIFRLIIRSLLYGLQVSIACFLMLVMMTYNSWMISAIVAGAIGGSFLYDCSVDRGALAFSDKSTACH